MALSYLLEKRGTKGKEIDYSYLEMASYLLPFNNFLTIDEKCELFSVKKRMINIPYNFSSKSEHKCEWENQPTLTYEKIFCGNLN